MTTTTEYAQALAQDYANSITQQFNEYDISGNPFGLTECGTCGAGSNIPCPCTEDRIRTASDFLDECLDIRYLVSYDRKTIKGGQILLASGGPTVWLYTGTQELRVCWGDSVTTEVPTAMCEAINDMLQELWENG